MFYYIFCLRLPAYAAWEMLVGTDESILINHTTAILNISQYVSYTRLIYVPCKLNLTCQFSKVI